MKRFLQEVRRRNVHRVAVVYLAASWLTLQVSEVLAEIYGFEGASLQWLVVVLAIGLVPVLALAWVFEITPQGLRRESEVVHEAELTGSRRTDRVVIVLLAAALTVLAADRFLLESAPPATPAGNAVSPAEPAAMPTIAVLPFADLSASRDQEFFATGIAEEVLNLLSRIPGLRVAARSSSFRLSNNELTVSEIAERLGVRYVLEGSVRAAGDRLRITVQLIDAESGFQIWSQTYDKRGEALFDVQDDVARQVADVLEVTILGEPPRSYRADPAAHALVLEADSLQAQTTPESMRLAVETYTRALDIDPGYARAWTGLSIAYTNMAGNGMLDWDEGHRQALEAAETALELDGDSTEALQQLAWIARTYQADSMRAARFLERALAIEPANPDLIGHAAVLLQAIGRLEDAVTLHEYSVARDPVDTRGLFNLALAYYFADRFDDAGRTLERVLALAPRYHGAWYRLGTVRLLQGRPQEALAAFEAEADPAFATKGRALALHDLGRDREADAALADLVAQWGQRWPSEIAQVHAYRGEVDAAFEWLEKDFAVTGAAGWGEWRLMHLYDNLHDDPRWTEFLRRVGASDEQLAAIVLRLPEGTRAAVTGGRQPA